jgi:hypothetical protein
MWKFRPPCENHDQDENPNQWNPNQYEDNGVNGVKVNGVSIFIPITIFILTPIVILITINGINRDAEDEDGRTLMPWFRGRRSEDDTDIVVGTRTVEWGLDDVEDLDKIMP